jgi:hypothetical protein
VSALLPTSAAMRKSRIFHTNGMQASTLTTVLDQAACTHYICRRLKRASQPSSENSIDLYQ